MADETHSMPAPTLSFIGSGKVATQLCKTLITKGVHIRQIVSKHLAHAEALAKKVHAFHYADRITDLDDKADIYVVAVKDDAIAGIVDSFPFCLSGSQIIVHTSGTFDENEFGKISKHYGCLYPLQTFKASGNTDLEHAPILYNAESDESRERIEQLAKLLSGKVFFMTKEKRQYVHVAAVFANNFTNHVLHLAEIFCQKYDLDFNLFWPLIKEGMSNAEKNGPGTAQTGPALRNDHTTLQNHKKLLANDPDLLNIYQMLTVSIQQMSQKHEDS